MEFTRVRLLFKKVTQFDLLALGAILALYFGLAFATIAKFSIWFDEAFSAYITRFDFWHIVVYTAQDVQPPLYYFLLKLWTILTGVSEVGVRSLSIVFGAVAIIFAYLLVRRLFTKYAAALAIFFMVLSPLFIRYSQEARMYTLVAAIAFAATYALVIAQQTKSKKAWLWYSVLVALGMWTHYFTALIWLAHITWHAFDVWKPGQKWGQFKKEFFVKEWKQAYGRALLFYVPWLPAFLIQAGVVQVAGFWIPELTAETVPNFISNVFLFREIGDVQSWLAIGLYGAVLFGIVATFWIYKNVRHRFLPLMICMAIVPVALLALASLPPFRPVFIDRYILTAGLMIPILIGIGLAMVRMKRYFKVAIAIIITLVLFVGTLHVYEIGNYNKNTQLANSTRQVIEEIYTKGAGNQPIIADSPWLFYEAIFYDKPEHPVYFLDSSIEFNYGSLAMLKQNDQFKIKDLAAFGAEHKTLWYISTLTEGKRNPPIDGWRERQEIIIDDAVNKKPLYRAVKYATD